MCVRLSIYIYTKGCCPKFLVPEMAFTRKKILSRNFRGTIAVHDSHSAREKERERERDRDRQTDSKSERVRETEREPERKGVRKRETERGTE